MVLMVYFRELITEASQKMVIQQNVTLSVVVPFVLLSIMFQCFKFQIFELIQLLRKEKSYFSIFEMFTHDILNFEQDHIEGFCK